MITRQVNRTTMALDALGNPIRRSLLEHIATGPSCLRRIAASYDVSRPAISRHLKILEDAGLVEHERMGRENNYRLSGTGFECAHAYLHLLWNEGAAKVRAR